MIGKLLKMYDEQRHNFHADEETSIIVWKLDALIERIRELEAENAELRNRVADYSGEIAALMTAKNLLLKQRAFLVGALEKTCLWHNTSGACPLFHSCPAGDVSQSCGEMMKEDWINTAIEVANDD